LGIVLFGALGLYIIVVIACVGLAARAAKQRGANPWVWGTLGGLAIYLPVFWDHLPTVLAHNYYCKKDAGFRIYKTLAQWEVEHPGVARTLTFRTIPALDDIVDRPDGSRRYRLNERFIMERQSHPIGALSTTKHDERFLDVKTGEMLAERVSVTSGYGTTAVARDIRSYKFWLSLDPCIPDKNAFESFYRATQTLGAKQ
jgi:hypothetical protein